MFNRYIFRFGHSYSTLRNRLRRRHTIFYYRFKRFLLALLTLYSRIQIEPSAVVTSFHRNG